MRIPLFTTLCSARLLIFYATFTREMSRHVIQIAPVSPVLEVKVSIKQQLSKLFLRKKGHSKCHTMSKVSEHCLMLD